MNSPKNTVIHQVRMARIEDEISVPTKISYDGKNFFVGRDAEKNSFKGNRVFQNFKVELGMHNRKQASLNRETVDKSYRRSFLGMTKDFLNAICDSVDKNIQIEGLESPTKILIAEPLSLDNTESAADSRWLTNYRSGVRAALETKFESIDFLPEPFAVFQFYRYGFRHPLIVEKKRHTALVLDFGGGTFDVSVIDTTAQGDISYGGKNSRPLAAKSIPIGGFYVNQQIAEELLFNTIIDKKDKSRARKIINRIGSFEGIDEAEFNLLDTERNFVRNFRILLEKIEGAKIRVVNSILNWKLDADLSHATAHMISVPQEPFTENGNLVEIQLKAQRVRSIFVEQIWNSRLKEALKAALTRAKTELEGKPISVVLLSGGSSNIKWLKPLLEKDLDGFVSDADIIEINDNYQEIVAKGLAVECARKFYDPGGDGDFGAVIYNKVNLGLAVNEREVEWKKFSPRTSDLQTPEDDGVLLPSAATIRSQLNKKMVWKVKLGSSPTNSLKYHYLKSSFDPNDYENVYNIVDNVVLTPKGWSAFGQSIDVELVVREDGTATPSFVYGKGRKQTTVEGRPFYLDMTYAATHAAEGTFLGLDFGTSTTAASIVSERDVKAYQDRGKDQDWSDLSTLISELPFPVTVSLASFMSVTEQSLMDKYGREALEAMLAFIAYTCYSEMKTNSGVKLPNISSSFRRSVGPLLNIIRELKRTGFTGDFIATKLLNSIDQDIFSKLNSVAERINDSKHSVEIFTDYAEILLVLGNKIKGSLAGFEFGRFESTKKKSFGSGYEGLFRCLVGANRTFVKLLNYNGPNDYSDKEIFLVQKDSNICIPVSPFYLWNLHEDLENQNSEDLFLLDHMVGDGEIKFRAVSNSSKINFKSNLERSELIEYVTGYFKQSYIPEKASNIKLNIRN